MLFHDSLGCVELWRDFPAQLSAASGRRVIAYDRLGFGRSDAREVLPELDFIAEEARRILPGAARAARPGAFRGVRLAWAAAWR